MYKNTHFHAPTESVNRQHPVKNLETNAYKLQYYKTVGTKLKANIKIPQCPSCKQKLRHAQKKLWRLQ